jgi:hypothetical protein
MGIASAFFPSYGGQVVRGAKVDVPLQALPLGLPKTDIDARLHRVEF